MGIAVASSISNSNSRIPSLPHGRAWALAIGLVVGLLLPMEVLARLNGYPGAPKDDPALWALARSHVRDDDPHQVVLLGSSRMQLGIDSSIFAETLGTDPPIQLAIVGSSPVPVLKHLAEKSGFQGTVLCEIFPGIHFKADNRRSLARPKEYLEFYDNRTATALLERQLKLWVELSFASMNSRFRPSRVLKNWIRTGEPFPPSAIVHADRTIDADFTRVDDRRERDDTGQYGPPMSPEQLVAALREIEAAVLAIHARGGQVVFTRFPAADTQYEAEGGMYPRSVFWEGLGRIQGVATIHFTDYPSLSQFTAADGSHLDFRVAEGFSRELGKILANRVPRFAKASSEGLSHDGAAPAP